MKLDFLKSYEIMETEKLAFSANFNIFQCLNVLFVGARLLQD